MNERWITIGEIAQTLGISRPTASKLLREQAIPGAVDYFGYTRVQRQVFEKWLKSKDRIHL